MYYTFPFGGLQRHIPVAHVIGSPDDGRGYPDLFNPLLHLVENAQITDAISRLGAIGGFSNYFLYIRSIQRSQDGMYRSFFFCYRIRIWGRRRIEQKESLTLIECLAEFRHIVYIRN